MAATGSRLMEVRSLSSWSGRMRGATDRITSSVTRTGTATITASASATSASLLSAVPGPETSTRWPEASSRRRNIPPIRPSPPITPTMEGAACWALDDMDDAWLRGVEGERRPGRIARGQRCLALRRASSAAFTRA